MSNKRKTTPEQSDRAIDLAAHIVEKINSECDAGMLSYPVILSALIHAASYFIAGLENEDDRKEVVDDFTDNLAAQVESDREDGVFAETARIT